ncbi:DUF6471 domain-containing protein [Telmatospirillum siberiense]|uniref:DUF6471 domain-containing protein n=1 Tax=Telmatospirillum siberiense TaxID=382514 RepID=UPI003B8335B3
MGGYDELARWPTEMGIFETAPSITLKISHGAFPMWFFLAAMKAIGTGAYSNRRSVGDSCILRGC